MSIADTGTPEGNKGNKDMQFTVTLSHATNHDVTIHVTSSDGTATAGEDYEAVDDTLTIPAGETTGTIGVSIIGDKMKESDE